MKILLKRAQTPGRFRSVVFKLWCKVDLEGDEQKIIDRYDFDQAVLVNTDQPSLMRMAIGAGIAAAVVLYFILNWILGSFGTFLALAGGAFAGWFVFDRFRETIYVKDLLYGRDFRCWSIVELASKEQYLKGIVAYLRQVMESAKHWDGTETVDAPPLDPDLAKQIMIRRHIPLR
ncbi:hypothetical protein [Oricola indica]|uniref:hypothetical protein n=1 Tax=Oricola indica TaxID=2872591 RepID=UPI003CCBFE88